MTTIEVTLPTMGEGITDATITKWLVSEGDTVEEDQPLVEIATDKVDSEVPAPVSGTVKKIICQEGEIPKIGEVLVVISTDEAVEYPEHEKHEEPENEEFTEQAQETEGEDNLVMEPEDTLPSEHAEVTVENQHKNRLKNQYISPYIRNLAKANNITLDELATIEGSGLNGTLTKHDMLNYMNTRLYRTMKKEKPEKEKPAPKAGHYAVLDPGVYPPTEKKKNGSPDYGRVEIIEMDRMRKLIAENMVRSVLTSPHVTSFVEADLTNLVQWRNTIKQKFINKYNEKLTYTPLIIEAVTKALKDYPLINASVENDKILVKKDINIGMATALTNGNLIVPVIKNADQLSLEGLASSVNDLAERARKNQLKPHEIKHGTFTITNLGPFGNVSGTPIINQPEVAILAAGAILRKPAVVKTGHGETLGIRDIMILSLTYDHRLVDGSLGGMFLKRVAEHLENFDVTRKV